MTASTGRKNALDSQVYIHVCNWLVCAFVHTLK